MSWLGPAQQFHHQNTVIGIYPHNNYVLSGYGVLVFAYAPTPSIVPPTLRGHTCYRLSCLYTPLRTERLTLSRPDHKLIEVDFNRSHEFKCQQRILWSRTYIAFIE